MTDISPQDLKARLDREPRPQGTELLRRFSKGTAPPDTTP